MDTEYLNQCVKKIQVKNLPNADVEVVNDSPLVMIGKGRQGAVFKVTEDICVKVFGNEEDCDREYYALSLGQHTNLFPKVQAKGPLHIAMDIIKGVDLREYLQSQPLTEELSLKLIEMLITFKEIGYERIDHHKRQIYLQPDGHLKVIDVARTVWRDRIYPYPRKLINSLGDEYKEVFLSHVQALAPELYKEWSHYIKMEELSRQLIQKMMTQSTDKKFLKQKSQRLLHSEDERASNKPLEDLVYKVFKDEWVKALLARGMNPDKVKNEIDAYWKKQESKLLTPKEESVEKKNSKKRRKTPPSEGYYSSKSKNSHSIMDDYYGYVNLFKDMKNNKKQAETTEKKGRKEKKKKKSKSK